MARLGIAACLVGCGSVLLMCPSPAAAAFGIKAFDGGVFGQDGQASTQAGGHPYAATTTFELNTKNDEDGNLIPDGGALKDVRVDLPPGLVGSPAAVPVCPMGVFLSDTTVNQCPGSTQVGIARIRSAFGAGTLPPKDYAVYNLEPAPGVAAAFGLSLVGVPIFFDARVGSEGGYHVQVNVRDVSQSLAVLGSSVTLWGVPSDRSHDAQRVCQGTNSAGCSVEQSTLKAFFTNPTACPPAGQGLGTQLSVDSWVNPGVFANASFVSHNTPGYSLDNPLPQIQWGSPTGPVGCDLLPFKPSIKATPDSSAPDSPTGLSVDLSFPQEGFESPAGLATAQLRRARVVLPEGMTISPSSADGLAACTDAQLGLGSDDPATCPDASKIGSVTATTPVLTESLEGGVYVGSQQSDDPGSGRMFRIFLVLENKQRGLNVKLAGQVRVRADGQVETVFDDNPQVPVSTISVRLKTGPRAPLATPLTCGEHTVSAELTSWGGQTANLTDTFTIDCPPDLGRFSPSFTAGSINPIAGAFSPLVVGINRSDRQQYLAGLTMQIPGGLVAKLRGVPLCGDPDASAGTCPVASRIGTATVGAGPGSAPFHLSAPVALTGPYRGAPYGLSVAVRVVAGPFDLGTVVVRQAVYVDPADAHLTVVSDPLPIVVKGVPVRLRSVDVDIDRPGFTMNPTSCSAKRIEATFTSAQGELSTQMSHFQVASCGQLPFTPRLSLKLTGNGQTTDGRHPGLKAVLTQPHNQSGIRKVAVKLPLSLALDPANAASDSLCEFDEGQKADPHCPKSSVIGRAKATTPLLNRPLAGNVYFVKNVRIDKRTGRRIRTLPTLLLALRGEVSLNVRVVSSTSGGKLISTISTVPDAPVTRFDLSLNGGRKGILVVNGNACKRDRGAGITINAQNGKRSARTAAISMPCSKRR